MKALLEDPNNLKAQFEDPSPKGVDLARLGAAGLMQRELRGSAAMPTGPPDGDDEFAFWRFKDLVARRIVTDRADLFRKQQRGFPRAVKFSKGQGAVALFPVAAVKGWLRANMNSTEAD